MYQGLNRHRLREATVLNCKLVGFPWTPIPAAFLFEPLGCSSAALHAETEGLVADRKGLWPFVLTTVLGLALAPHRQGEGRWAHHLHQQLYLSMVCSL